MKEEHQKIINLISGFLKENPNQRFGQAIFNLGVLEFADKSNPENQNYHIRDIYNDQDHIIIDRIESQIVFLEKQKN